MKIKINNLIQKYKFYFTFLLISLTPLIWFGGKLPFTGGDLDLGLIYNFKYSLHIVWYAWRDFLETGIANGSSQLYLLYFCFKSCLRFFNFSYWFIQSLDYILSFLISLVSVFIFCKDLFYKEKDNKKIAFFSALFFVFNPLSSFLYFGGLTFVTYVLPFSSLLFCVVNRYLKTNKKFYLFGMLPLIYILYQSVFVNPAFVAPTFLILIIFVFYIINTSYYKNKNIKLGIFLFNFSLISVLINIYWILPFFNLAKQYLIRASLPEDPLQVLNYISNNFFRLYDFFRLLPFGYSYDLWVYKQSNWFLWFFNSPYLIFLGSFLFIFIIFFSVHAVRDLKKSKSIMCLFLALSLLGIFLMKGTSKPFGYIYLFLSEHVPYFSAFRSSYNKFAIILIISSSILFGVSFTSFWNYLKQRFSYFKSLVATIILLTIFLGIYNFPLLTGAIFRDPIKIRGNIISSETKVPNYYQDVSLFFNKDKEDYRNLALPLRPLSYAGFNWEYGYDSTDPTSILFQHKTISSLNYSMENSMKILGEADENGINKIYNLASLYNVKFVINQKDIDSIHGNYNKVLKDSDKINSELRNIKQLIFIDSVGQLDIFRVPQKNLLPHFYVPQTLITSSQSIETLPAIVSQPDYKIRSAIYFNSANQTSTAVDTSATSSELAFNSNELKKEVVNNTPIVEFKKINPIKYRVIIHHATENFPLVFSESFHDGWKSYLVDYQKSPLNFDETDYKILDGNGDDQASAEELKNYINSGYISSLGNLKTETIKHVKWVDNREVFDYNENYKIDFISKNFQDTIQNDNLAAGRFYETWLSKPVDDNQNHLMVNGYANSWNINPNELCGAPEGKALCVKNADGSYDMELVVEFWPQRLFYIGLFISGMTLMGCLGYLWWGIVRKRKGLIIDREEGKDD